MSLFHIICCIYIGKFTTNKIIGHLIIPQKITHNGQHLSNNLTHHHNGMDIDDYNDEDHNNLTVHYHMHFDNETIHIELK